MEILKDLIVSLAAKSPEALVGCILIVILLTAITILWKAHQKQQAQHREEYKGVVKEMFDVIQKNTESNTQLKDSIRELSLNIRK
jgi:cell division protein FtsL